MIEFKHNERKENLMNLKTKAMALVLSVVAAFSMCSFSAAASGATEAPVAKGRIASEPIVRYELSVSKVYNRSTSAYSAVTVLHNGRRILTDARMINGVPYVAVRGFFEELTDMTVTYYSQNKTLNVRGAGFEMDVIDGGNVIYANGRTLFSMTPSALMTDGRMYAPLSLIAKAVGMSYSYSGGGVSLYGAVKPITHASSFYREDEVYWLSRIISAESRGEPLLGQIAVGCVVLNRVKSPLYPNTIWSVIFDKKYGVQFSPVLDGSIYANPSAPSVVAAKICLEGFRVNESALFFLYPRYSTSSWIPNNRPYLFSIGKHDFYA